SGRRMSVRQRSKPWRASRARALATLSASRTRRPSWSRVMWSNSRMSASSSTINTWGLFMVTAFQDLAGVDETDAKEAGLGGGGGLVFQGGVVDFAKFAGDVEAKAGALAGGGEERFEQFAAILFRHPGAAVENVEHRHAVDAAEPRPQPRPGLAAGLQAVARGAVAGVAEHVSAACARHRSRIGYARESRRRPGGRRAGTSLFCSEPAKTPRRSGGRAPLVAGRGRRL